MVTILLVLPHYYPISSITQAIVRIEEATEDNDNQYVDGIMFGADHIKPGNGMLLDTIKTSNQRMADMENGA
jgi:hypothetical protein